MPTPLDEVTLLSLEHTAERWDRAHKILMCASLVTVVAALVSLILAITSVLMMPAALMVCIVSCGCGAVTSGLWYLCWYKTTACFASLREERLRKTMSDLGYRPFST